MSEVHKGCTIKTFHFPLGQNATLYPVSTVIGYCENSLVSQSQCYHTDTAPIDYSDSAGKLKNVTVSNCHSTR